MPRRNEAAFNYALGQILTRKNPHWTVVSESTGIFSNEATRPDILIDSKHELPVIIELEYSPARTVEFDAKSRIGQILKSTGYGIEHAIALRAPKHLVNVPDSNLDREIGRSHFDVAIYTGTSPESTERWPRLDKKWISCDIDALIRIIELTSISEHIVGRYMLTMEEGVNRSANILTRNEDDHPDAIESIAESLYQEDCEQTRRMAMAIILNAILFHNVIAGRDGIVPFENLTGRSGIPNKRKIVKEWKHIIEKINYLPIFSIASDILDPMPQSLAVKILRPLNEAAEYLVQHGITTSHDLSGRMFQRLIADRKFLATYYTLPESAYLLANLAAGRLKRNWSDQGIYSELRIADLACGTGTLLSAAYQSVLTKARHNNVDSSIIHRKMIEDAIIGADIMPAATHLAVSQLASAHPRETFGSTKIYTMPYGTTQDGRISTGSLELIQEDKQLALFSTGAAQLSGTSEENIIDNTEIKVPTNSLDMCIMNPPFTRPTNHESDHYDVPIPSFAAFGTSHNEQKKMSQRLKAIRDRLKSPAGNGNAGLASYFIDLAHQKTKAGGVVAFVLPLTCTQGESWENARQLLDRCYDHITVVSIISDELTGSAFSADTGMAEVLIVANKLNEPISDDHSASTLFVNILKRPQSLVESYVIAEAIRKIPKNKNNGHLKSGTLMLGNWYKGSIHRDTGGVQVHTLEIHKICRDLTRGNLELPRLRDLFKFPMVALDEIGERGPLHRDISERGPFDLNDIEENEIPSYPMLWNHSADRERCLIVSPDKKGDIRQGADEDAIKMWDRFATRLHFSLDFRITSQSLVACFTKAPTLGGTAWPSYVVNDEYVKPIVLWCNTTLGLMSFWHRGMRQQQGRSRLTITSLPDLVVLDPRSFSQEQLTLAEDIFDEVKEHSLLPANEAYRDDTRKLLDRLVLCDLMNLSENVLESLEIVRDQWCAEPTVHGGKATKIDTS